MRYGNAEKLTRLAFEMQGSRTGLCLEDIERRLKVGRRTAQRMRDALLRTFPQIEEEIDEERRPRWRFPTTFRFEPGELTAKQIADLEAAARLCRREGQRARARSIETLVASLRARLKPETNGRIDPDLEALLEAEGLACRPGPRPMVREDHVETLRLAILRCCEVHLTYKAMRGERSSGRRLQPLGFLFGSRQYVVGLSPDKHPDEPRLFALSNIKAVKPTERSFTRPKDFSLQAFAEQSFGVFREPKQEIVWRFKPEVAPIAEAYHFHPTQELSRQADGSLLVRFHAGGLTEMAWHLYTWGDGVEVLAPEALKARMATARRHRQFQFDEPQTQAPAQKPVPKPATKAKRAAPKPRKPGKAPR